MNVHGSVGRCHCTDEAVEALGRVVVLVDLHVDETNAGAGELLPHVVDDVDDRPAGLAGAERRRRERDHERVVRAQALGDRVAEQVAVGRDPASSASGSARSRGRGVSDAGAREPIAGEWALGCTMKSPTPVDVARARRSREHPELPGPVDARVQHVLHLGLAGVAGRRRRLDASRRLQERDATRRAARRPAHGRSRCAATDGRSTARAGRGRGTSSAPRPGPKSAEPGSRPSSWPEPARRPSVPAPGPDDPPQAAAIRGSARSAAARRARTPASVGKAGGACTPGSDQALRCGLRSGSGAGSLVGVRYTRVIVPSCIDAPATVGSAPSTKHATSIANARRTFMCGVSFRCLEPDVLQRFCGPAVVPRGRPVLPLRPARSPRATQTAARWLGEPASSAVVSALVSHSSASSSRSCSMRARPSTSWALAISSRSRHGRREA